jgi:hypothetical protein
MNKVLQFYIEININRMKTMLLQVRKLQPNLLRILMKNMRQKK